MTQAIARGADRHRAHRRADVVDDRASLRTPQVKVPRPVGISHRLVAGFALAPELAVFFGVDRARGNRPFGPRERDLAAAAIEGLGWFHRRLVQSYGLLDGASPLSPREREALSLLLTGQPEKQIAAAMGLTPRSAHQVITAVYRKLGVRSRTQLLADWLGSR
jgi:DNA-binding CsgD family transcriptional regulator